MADTPDNGDQWSADDEFAWRFFELLEEREEVELAERLDTTPWSEIAALGDPKIRALVAEVEADVRLEAVYEDPSFDRREKALRAIDAKSFEVEPDVDGVPPLLPLYLPSRFATAEGRRSTLKQGLVVVSLFAAVILFGRIIGDAEEAAPYAFFVVLVALPWSWWLSLRLRRRRNVLLITGDRIVEQRLLRSIATERREVRQVVEYQGTTITRSGGKAAVTHLLLFLGGGDEVLASVDLRHYEDKTADRVAAALDMKLRKITVEDDNRALTDRYPGALDGSFLARHSNLGCIWGWVAFTGAILVALPLTFFLVAIPL